LQRLKTQREHNHLRPKLKEISRNLFGDELQDIFLRIGRVRRALLTSRFERYDEVKIAHTATDHLAALNA